MGFVEVAPAEAAAVGEHWLTREVGGNPLSAWLLAGAGLAAAVLVFWLLKRLAVSRLKRLAGRTTSGADDLAVDLLAGARLWLFVPLAVYVASRGLALDEGARTLLRFGAVAAVTVQALLSMHRLVDFGLGLWMRRGVSKDHPDDSTVSSSLGVVRFLALLLVYSVIVLVALENLGIDVTAMLAGLGIGAVAIALAVQNILGDLFGSLSIVLDKPFVVGDFIVVGQQMGTVERIGIKTTRVRALSGEQLVFSNSDLLSSRIQNFKRMQERRVVFSVGVEYGTPLDRLRLVPGVLKDAVLHRDKTRFDRANLSKLAESQLEYEVVYFVLSADFNLYMNIQEQIYLEVIDRLRGLEVGFAFPTRTVEVQIPQAGEILRRLQGAGTRAEDGRADSAPAGAGAEPPGGRALGEDVRRG